MLLNKVKQPEHKTDLIDNAEEEGRYALVSAHLLNYLPGISYTEHENIYRNIIVHRNLAVEEQDDPGLLNRMTCEGAVDECITYIKEKPGIICTMHTGSYRALNRYLIEEGIPFALLTGNTVLETEAETLRHIYSTFSRETDADLQIINAEQSSAGLQMLRTLKRGKSLVVYLDGHSGAGTTTNENENSCVIDFLQQQLIVRKGIAFLAHAADVPVFPVASYRNSTSDIRLLFYQPVVCNKFIDRDAFAISTTQLLYNKFAQFIAAYPEQWEGWLNLHKNIKLIHQIAKQQNKGLQKGKKFLFNNEHFCNLKTGGLPFLFDKRQYLFYPLEIELYHLLRSCTEKPVLTSSVSEESLKTLLNMGVVRLL